MIGICKNENGWYISKHNKQLGVQYYKTLIDVMPVAYAEEYKSTELMKDLYKQIPNATSKDLASVIEFLKRAREVRVGKTKQSSQARKNYVKKQLIKPICLFGGRVVQEQHCKWL
jgi:hypothetical protein